MLLQRCTNKVTWLCLMLAMLVLSGCGGSAAVKSSDAPGQTAGSEPLADGGELAPAIPAAALTLFEQAAAAMAGGDFVDAELRFKEFLLQFPDYPGAHVNLAIIHAGNGNDEAARASIDSALAMEANHPAALNQLGMLLRRNGNFLEAEAAYLKAVTVSPEYALAHYNLGVLNELYLQRLDSALQHFETYQSLVGEDKQVARWIKDLTRRVAANQRTANVAD
jgi:Flp pilus assembly protein TadD